MAIKIKGRHIAALGAGALGLAGFLITGFESPNGEAVLQVYPDPVSHGAPYTYCDGLTAHPKFGHHYTKAECDTETAAEVRATNSAVLACTRPVLTIPVQASFVSLAWNIGVPTFCKSSIASNAKAGNFPKACAAISLYDKAGPRGHVRAIPGLTFRRGQERQVCEGQIPTNWIVAVN